MVMLILDSLVFDVLIDTTDDWSYGSDRICSIFVCMRGLGSFDNQDLLFF